MNTSFFHKTASTRRKMNNITRMKDNQNNITSDKARIESIIRSYYSDLFSTQNPSDEEICIITDLIQPIFCQDMNNKLSPPLSKEEVRRAFFDLNPSKAPGPNGFTTLFFQNAWETIGEDITQGC